ncbi:MAG: C39 family peptidase [Deltaproteobacteria bacterium]|nr:C39 family peptidase [Deltaproteobacteria bacterium]
MLTWRRALAGCVLPSLLVCLASAERAPKPKAPPPKLPPSAQAVPLVIQPYGFDCGAAAARAVLYYWGAYQGSQRSLYPILNTRSSYGTSPRDLLRGVRRLGLKAELKERMTVPALRKALKEGYSVLVELQAWIDRSGPKIPWAERWDDGHWTAVVGVDRHYVYFMDPSSGDSTRPVGTAAYAYIPIKEFKERWHEWDEDGKRLKHFFQPGVLIKGDRPAGLPLGTVIQGKRPVEAPLKNLVRML